MTLFPDEAPRATRSGADWEQHRRHRQPFAGPPRDEVGVPASTSFELARSADVVVAVRGTTAFSDGLLLHVVVLFSDEQRREEIEWGLREYSRNPGRFRLGVQLADGTRAVTGSGDAPDVLRPEAGSLLTLQAARHDLLTWQGDYWLWPLPQPGPMVLGCTWPDRGIAESRVLVDADPLLQAAAGSRPVWRTP